jgi:hypothetical protein
MEHDLPFQQPSNVGNLLTNMTKGRGKHVFIHNVWAPTLHIQSMRIQDMCFEISFISKQGKLEDQSHQMTGKCFNEVMSNLNSLQKINFVYDGTKNNRNVDIVNVQTGGTFLPAPTPLEYNNIAHNTIFETPKAM